MNKFNYRSLSSNGLKLFACMTMLIDHIGLVLMDNNRIMRGIGRLAFPIFVFFLVEGLKHTSDIKKYIGRLLIFAVISEPCFDLAIAGKVMDLSHQNVFFTLAIGLYVASLFDEDSPLYQYKWFITFILAFVAQVTSLDYGAGGIMLICFFKHMDMGDLVKTKNPEIIFSSNLKLVIITGLVYVLCWGPFELYALFSTPFINMYNGKRGRLKLKYFFYLFYPCHFLALWFIGRYVINSK